MTLFALFLCVQASGQCYMQGAARMTFAGPMPGMTFNSLADCQQYAKRVSGLITPPANGHFVLSNNSGMWYECRSKHVETWQPAH